MTVTFFPVPTDFRQWLAKHHSTEKEILVGYYKKGSGKPSITWPESVDEALCFGWIDGIRRSIDDISYSIRFTPRKARSIWSAVNIKRVQALVEDGRMQQAGLAAYELRQENRSGIYSYEQRRETLDEPYEKLLRKNKAAWKFFQEQPASYRRAACWWVVSAKIEDTRLRRLGRLIELSANGDRIPQFTSTKPSK
jgi:uncharacterized protein YdeI (YjbR/CyaY-like superfamily)